MHCLWRQSWTTPSFRPTLQLRALYVDTSAGFIAVVSSVVRHCGYVCAVAIFRQNLQKGRSTTAFSREDMWNFILAAWWAKTVLQGVHQSFYSVTRNDNKSKYYSNRLFLVDISGWCLELCVQDCLLSAKSSTHWYFSLDPTFFCWLCACNV